MLFVFIVGAVVLEWKAEREREREREFNGRENKREWRQMRTKEEGE